MKLFLTLLLVMVLAPVCGRAQVASGSCPLIIGIGYRSAIYDIHPRTMVATETTLQGLRSHVVNGCYNDSHPFGVTSVTVRVSNSSLRGTVAQVYAMLAQAGWPRSRVRQMVWTAAPR